MAETNPNYPEATVYLLTHVGNDARNAASVLDKAKIPAQICTDVPDLCRRAIEQAGALLVSEEALDEGSLEGLMEFLVSQPPWSDLPIILLTPTGELRARTHEILNFLGRRGNVTLLEKPLRAITLISVVRTALRARMRQYDVRKLLCNYTRAVEDQQTATAKFQAVFEQSSVFAGIMTLEGVITEANRLWLDACAYRAEEVVGKLFWECPWWRDSREVREKIRKGTQRAAKGEPFREVLPYVWADGTKRIMEFGLHPIRDEAGHVIFLHPSGVDVTGNLNILTNTMSTSEPLFYRLSMP